MPAALLVGDLETGEHVTLPAGTVFAGWPAAPVVDMDGLAKLAACEPAAPEDAAAVAMSASGTLSPASAGAKPVVGERQDADPFRRGELAGAPAVEAQADGLLTLALPAGACVEATMVEAVLADPAADATSVTLGARLAGSGTAGVLVSVAAPPAGDWVVRAKLWLADADREAILLYHVRVAEPAGPGSWPGSPQP